MHPVLGYFKGHNGVDFGAACGTPVAASQSGTVIAVEYNSASGKRVKIDHGNGVITGYYHLQGYNTSVGALVSAGETIGYVGSTGRSTGCHLHFAKMDEAGNYSEPDVDPAVTTLAPPIVLGVESSCDETGFGLVSDGVLLGQGLASSAAQHADFGGVVPEIAARAHLEAVVPTLQIALDDAGVDLDDVSHIAVTSGPGLATAVHVGLAAAKSIAWALGKPLYGVHHLAGHAAADILEHGPLPERSIVLIVSGGHTSILAVGDLVRDPIEHLGDTLDDAAGEAFDKVSRLLGLGYPGGPAISRAAVDGDPAAFSFPRAMLRPKRRAVHLLLLRAQDGRRPHRRDPRARRESRSRSRTSPPPSSRPWWTCWSRRRCAPCASGAWTPSSIVGGVAANARLRAVAQSACDAAGIELRIPPPRLCTDNGAMIAAVGDLLVRSGAEPSGLGIAADPSAVLHGAQLPAAAVRSLSHPRSVTTVTRSTTRRCC